MGHVAWVHDNGMTHRLDTSMVVKRMRDDPSATVDLPCVQEVSFVGSFKLGIFHYLISSFNFFRVFLGNEVTFPPLVVSGDSAGGPPRIGPPDPAISSTTGSPSFSVSFSWGSLGMPNRFLKTPKETFSWLSFWRFSAWYS